MHKRTLYPKICKQCHVEYQGRKESVYCSPQCRFIGAPLTRAENFKYTIRPCKICGSPMAIGGKDGRNLQAVTCSRACATQHRVILLTKPLEIRLCLACDKPFGVGGKRGQNPRNIYCSIECRRKAQYISSKKCQKLTEAQAAYIAGFVDGEGCISITKSPQNYFGIVITIVNTKSAPLLWIAKVTGLGTVPSRPGMNERCATQYIWQASAEGAETLLQQIMPYLLIKEPQAKLAISLQEGLRIPRRKIDKSWQWESFRKIHVLNKRGPKLLELTIVA